MIEIKRFNSQSNGFESGLKNLLSWETESDQAIFDTVNEIIRSIKLKGDQALLEYTEKFDGLVVKTASNLELPRE
jgi:histidinol dehydrogenase